MIVKPEVCFNNGFISCRVRLTESLRGAIETDGILPHDFHLLFFDDGDGEDDDRCCEWATAAPPAACRSKLPCFLASFPTLALCPPPPSVSPATVFPLASPSPLFIRVVVGHGFTVMCAFLALFLLCNKLTSLMNKFVKCGSCESAVDVLELEPLILVRGVPS